VTTFTQSIYIIATEAGLYFDSQSKWGQITLGWVTRAVPSLAIGLTPSATGSLVVLGTGTGTCTCMQSTGTCTGTWTFSTSTGTGTCNKVLL